MAKTAIYWLAQLGTAAACALLGCLAAVGLAKVFWWLANGAERLGMMESGSIRMVHGGTMATSLGPIIVALVFLVVGTLALVAAGLLYGAVYLQVLRRFGFYNGLDALGWICALLFTAAVAPTFAWYTAETPDLSAVIAGGLLCGAPILLTALLIIHAAGSDPWEEDDTA